jgi:hypothetical protein
VLALFYRPFLFITLYVFAARIIVQAVVWKLSLRKLGEQDLFWYCWPLEVLLCLYYLVFFPALIRKQKIRWN